MISLQYLYCPQSWKSCPQFRKSEEARQKWPILTPKKMNMKAKKKDIPRIHIDMCFLQKTGSKLVKFGLCDPINILQPAIGGRHPVPCLSTQITERQVTAMYYHWWGLGVKEDRNGKKDWQMENLNQRRMSKRPNEYNEDDPPVVQYAGQCHHQERRSPRPRSEVCFLWSTRIRTRVVKAKRLYRGKRLKG